MISIEECKKYLGNDLDENQVKDLRDALYAFVECIVDDYINSCASIEPTCPKPSSTVEFQVSDKKMKVTA